MRRFWQWLVITALVVVLSGLGWRWVRAEWLGRPVSLAEQQAAVALQQDPVWAATQVHPDRLWADVEALSFRRFEEGDRQMARTHILQALAAAGWETQQQSFAADGIRGTNLVAIHPGIDPQQGTVLLGAHYDTVARSPGADDNASGVATVLEVARLLAAVETPRTLELVLFDQEETGLWGSEAVAADWAARPEMGDRVAVILDMIGYRCTEPQCQSYPEPLPIAPPTDQGDFLAVLADQPHPELLTAFHSAADSTPLPVVSLAIPLLGNLAPDFFRSDHAPFWDRRIGAALVTDTGDFRNPHYHQPSDTPDTLDPKFLADSAQIVAHAIVQLLFRPSSP